MSFDFGVCFVVRGWRGLRFNATNFLFNGSYQFIASPVKFRQCFSERFSYFWQLTWAKNQEGYDENDNEFGNTYWSHKTLLGSFSLIATIMLSFSPEPPAFLFPEAVITFTIRNLTKTCPKTRDDGAWGGPVANMALQGRRRHPLPPSEALKRFKTGRDREG